LKGRKIFVKVENSGVFDTEPFQDNAFSNFYLKNEQLSSEPRYCKKIQRHYRICLDYFFSFPIATWVTAINNNCLAALPAKDVCVQQSHAAKHLPRLANASSPKTARPSHKRAK